MVFNIYNKLVERVNINFDENKQELWAFVGSKSKGKEKNIASLKNATGFDLTRNRGNLEAM